LCIVALKYFKEVGFCGVKSRDRNYKPNVIIKQSTRKGIERMLLWDEKTKWTEGLNEFGVAILSSAVAVKKDEKEGSVATDEQGPFMSPDGKKIRTALFQKTPKKALTSCIDLELSGNTLIFDSETCFLLEGAFVDKKFNYKFKEIDKDQSVVRTNHGLMIASGYKSDSDDKHIRIASKSSVSRMLRVRKDIKKVQSHLNLLDAISDVSNEDTQLNPLRKSETHNKSILVTTGQIMICPKELTMYYRPVWCDVELENFSDLNSEKSKTFFQIISNRKLIQTNLEENSFVNFLKSSRL